MIQSKRGQVFDPDRLGLCQAGLGMTSECSYSLPKFDHEYSVWIEGKQKFIMRGKMRGKNKSSFNKIF